MLRREGPSAMVVCTMMYRVAGKPWALFVSQNSEWPPFCPTLFVRNGLLWEVREVEISTRDRRGTLILIPFLGLSLPFFGVKKHQSVSIRKTKKITQWNDQKCMLFDTSCFKNLLLTSGKSAHRKKFIFFAFFWASSFFTVFSTICGTVVEENEKTQRDRN